jgi:hypothetical protein
MGNRQIIVCPIMGEILECIQVRRVMRKSLVGDSPLVMLVRVIERAVIVMLGRVGMTFHLFLLILLLSEILYVI